jgi:transcriptional regulator with XRE-family HTH domain
MSGYVNGRAFPSIDVLVEIANVLDVSIDWLCNRQSVNDEANTQEERTLGDAVRALSSLVENGYAEIGTYKYTTDVDVSTNGEYPHWIEVDAECPMLIFKKNSTDKSNSANSLSVFLEDFQKMRGIFTSGTIDYRLFNDWISGRFKSFDEMKMQYQQEDGTEIGDDDMPF